jgi:hypothetical protein
MGTRIVMGAWAAFLMIGASVAVFGRERRAAQSVFGAPASLMILSNSESERAARQLGARMEEIGSQSEGFEGLSPEEPGRKVGEFFKGIEEGANNSDADQNG